MTLYLDSLITPGLSPPLCIARETVLKYLGELRDTGSGSSTLNVALAALKLLSRELWIRGFITGDSWNAISDIRAEKRLGKRLGKWTDEDGVQQLLEACADSRERALIAVLCGCGLRRSEVAALKWEQYQEWHGRKVFVDITGKARRIRSVAVPHWVREIVDEYQMEERTGQ